MSNAASSIFVTPRADWDLAAWHGPTGPTGAEHDARLAALARHAGLPARWFFASLALTAPRPGLIGASVGSAYGLLADVVIDPARGRLVALVAGEHHVEGHAAVLAELRAIEAAIAG